MALNQQITFAEQLQSQVSGLVLTPDSGDYEQARRGWNRTVDQHPALILVADDAQDVVAGVRFACDHGLGVGVQLTGHGVQHPADGQLLIVTARLKSVEVNVAAQTVRVGGGVVWKDVLDAVTPHGLAPLTGTAPDVGVVGYTLAGGISWLGRRYGFAADSVLSVDLVTADGVLRHASPTENSELFWGVRGAGGSFGVVTAMEFRLYPVPTLYGGRLIYAGEQVGEALRFFRDWTQTLPEAMTSMISVLKFPSLPQLPEAMRGKVFVHVRAAFDGPAAEGAALMQPWLDWHAPVENTLRLMPFAEIGTIADDPVEPRPTHTSNELFDDLSDEALDVIVRYATSSASPLIFSELRHTGGAMSRVPDGASAVGNRGAAYYMQMGGMTPTPEALAASKAYIAQYKAALRPYLRGGVYLNFYSGGTEARERVKDAYEPETYRRLLDLKARVDPHNLFRFSFLSQASGEI